MSVRAVDFRRRRHDKVAKDLIDSTCFVISDLDCRVAGYAVVAWDDTGHSSIAFRSGGPISGGAVGTHVGTKLSLACKMAVEERRS